MRARLVTVRTEAAILTLALLFALAASPAAAQQFFIPDDPAFGSGTGRKASFDELNAILESKLETVRRSYQRPAAAGLLGGLAAVGALAPESTEEAELHGALPPVLRILVLGLDRRMNWAQCHADAIHLFTVEPRAGRVTITTVPRGYTGFRVPGRPGAYAAEAYYYGGRELMKACVEAHLGVQVDHVAEFDFAAAMRALELIGYDGKATLRFLRHRKSYGAGDYQRCHNQALFMKHQIPRVLPFFRMAGGELLLRSGHALLSGDLDYPTCRRLVNALLASGIENDPDRVALEMKPDFRGPLRDDEVPEPEDMDAKVAAQYAAIGAGRDRSPDFSMASHLRDLIARAAPLLTVRDAEAASLLDEAFERKLWNQVPDHATRRHLHGELAELYAAALDGTGQPARAEAVRREARETHELRDMWQLPEMEAAAQAAAEAKAAEERAAAEAARAKAEETARHAAETTRTRSGSRFGKR